jgi:hypothetical protein
MECVRSRLIRMRTASRITRLPIIPIFIDVIAAIFVL